MNVSIMPSGRLFGCIAEKDVMVPMRDGVRLATDIYRPAVEGAVADEPFPVILERTPYNKSAVSRSERTEAEPQPASRAAIAEYFVRHGYIVIYQDCRGRYGSEGEFTKYLDDGRDGFDTLAWIVGQSWCNGRIGTMGLSYATHTQTALASLNPPGLAAMFLDSGGHSNAYQSGIRQGGAFELKQATWAYNEALKSPAVTANPATHAALCAANIREWFTRMPWREGHSPLQWAPEYEAYLLEQWTNGSFGPYWQQVGLYAEGHYKHFPDIPIVCMASWYDVHPKTAVDIYNAMSPRNGSPVRLIMGPWTHGNRSESSFGDVEFGPDAPIDGKGGRDFREIRLRFFDRWLRGIDNGVDDEAPVSLFVMGGGSGNKTKGGIDHGGRWRGERDWPVPGTEFTPYYLSDNGSLSPEPPSAYGSLSFDFDPRNPVPTIGGCIAAGAPVMEGGPFNQHEDARFFGCKPPYLPLSSRPDILVFQTPPLFQDVEVTGPIRATLFVSSDGPDTDFTVKLIDVYPSSEDYPQGFALNLTDGIIRCRYRTSWEHPQPMEPGAVYEVVIECYPTSNLFKAGHRIRLDVSSSNFPRFDVNPNTGEPEARSRRARVACNTVHVGPTRKSHVLLPIVPHVRPHSTKQEERNEFPAAELH
jgi:putative CocE/NonD family hydrolase